MHSVLIGDEARAGKIKWGEGIYLPMEEVSVLQLVMVQGGMHVWHVVDGGEGVLGGQG